MHTIQQFASHTPYWVWAILAFLLWRGIDALKPSKTSLARLAVVPAIFTVWGLWSLHHRYGASIEAWGVWLLGIAIGAGIGWLLVRRQSISYDAVDGHLHRTADYSLLPLLVLTFIVKYAFEAALATAPALADNTVFRMAHLLVSGGFTGVFIGKFLHYLRVATLSRQQALPT